MRFEDEIIADNKRSLFDEKSELIKMVRAGERYERLLANKDFQDCLNDLREVLKVHREQLAIMDIDLDQANNPFKINRIATSRKMHLNRMQQIGEAIRQPERLVAVAKEARARIEEIEKEEPKHA